jgi:hypothetical protein
MMISVDELLPFDIQKCNSVLALWHAAPFDAEGCATKALDNGALIVVLLRSSDERTDRTLLRFVDKCVAPSEASRIYAVAICHAVVGCVELLIDYNELVCRTPGAPGEG